MSATLTPPAPAAPTPIVPFVPRPFRWDVATFHAVNATGAFAGRRPMLLRGVLMEQGPMNPPHATAVDLTVDVLRSIFTTGWRVRGQTPLVLGLETDPFPDVAVIAGGPRDFSSAHPTTAALVVEVSDTTLATDMTEKAELYATAGVADYWVLDVVGRRLLVYRDPLPLSPNLGAVAYSTHLTLGPDDTVSPLAAPHSQVKVADLLP